MTARDFSERDIHLALDGELPADDRAGYEAWLNANPEMKARSQRFADDRRRLEEALAPMLDEAVPERLARLVTGDIKPMPRRASNWRSLAAAAVLLAIGAGGGYVVGIGQGGITAEAEDRLVEQAVSAFDVYTGDQGHKVEVGADNKAYLLKWLSNRTGLKLTAPDLAAEGFELVGGRLLPGDKRSAAMLLYEGAGGSLTIYVTAEGGDKTWGVREPSGAIPGAVYWLDQGWGCAIVGTLPGERLTEVAKNAYKQLRTGAGV